MFGADKSRRFVREGSFGKQAQGSLYRIRVTPPTITLRPGRNELRIEYAVKGRYTSRTLVYWNGRPEQKQSEFHDGTWDLK